MIPNEHDRHDHFKNQKEKKEENKLFFSNGDSVKLSTVMFMS